MHAPSRRIAQDAPILFCAKCACIVRLPKIVEGREEDHVVCELALQAPDRRRLVCRAWVRPTIVAALRGPTRLRQHRLLPSARGADALRGVDRPSARLGRLDVRVEKGVGVGGGEIRGMAEFGMGHDSIKGVDRHDIALVACSLELGARSAYGVDDGTDHGGALLVDDLVADADGLDVTPVAIHRLDEQSYFSVDLMDIVDAREDLHAFRLRRLADGGHLVAVGTIDTDEAVAFDLRKVGAHLSLTLAGVIGVVGRVHDSQARGAFR